MKHVVLAISIGTLLVALLTGCSALATNLAVQGTGIVAPATDTPLPAVGPTRTATFDDITFAYASSLAQNVRGAVQPAVAARPDAPYWEAAPRFTLFTFDGYVLTKTTEQPRIQIYPVAEFRTANAQAGQKIDALQSYLASKPLAAGSDLPFLPLVNAKQSLGASIKRLAFHNGSGVRYLTQYNQGPTAINNHSLFYTYQGITDDGRYYVSAVLPVANPTLPADEQTSPSGDYRQYIATVTQKLEAQPATSFTPNLTLLDALMETLTVHPR